MIIKNKLAERIRKTYKNKLVAITLLAIGILSTFLASDATFLVFTMIIGLPLFFARKNYIS